MVRKIGGRKLWSVEENCDAKENVKETLIQLVEIKAINIFYLNTS